MLCVLYSVLEILMKHGPDCLLPALHRQDWGLGATPPISGVKDRPLLNLNESWVVEVVESGVGMDGHGPLPHAHAAGVRTESR